MLSLPETVGAGAMLVDGNDAQTWANAMKQTLMAGVLRKDFVRRGLQQAPRLTWQRCAQETIDVYRSVVEERLVH